MQSFGVAHWSFGVWQSNCGSHPDPIELEMQSHPGVQEAPVEHVAGAHRPIGSAQEHTSPGPQSESVLQPWMHAHEKGKPPSGCHRSQCPYGSGAQSESEWHVPPASGCAHAPPPSRGRKVGHVTCDRRRVYPSAQVSYPVSMPPTKMGVGFWHA
jgi:hypothetical protein